MDRHSEKYSERYKEYFCPEDASPGYKRVVKQKRDALIARLNFKLWLAWMNWKAGRHG